MDHINTTFKNMTLPSSKTNPAIRAAIEIAKQTPNKYYSLMDAFELYWIVIGMLNYCVRVLFYY